MTNSNRLITATLILVTAVATAFVTWFLLGRETEPLQSEVLLRFEPTSSTPTRFEPPASQTPRNLVILIGDGMGFSHLKAASSLIHGPDGRLTIERFPITGWAHTHSANDLYTDSAAGATALATGQKTKPGAVSVDADGASLSTLFEAARDAGKAVGVITDSAFFDATPAAFLAHRESRRDTLNVIEDMTSSGADVIIGETHQRLEEHEQWPQTLAGIEQRGVTVARSLEDLEASSGPVLGLIDADTIALSDEAPDLEDFAGWAVERLAADPEGFVLMIETEETDTASHRWEFERMVRGVDTLDRIAKQLVERFGDTGETLVLVTADHETGGLALYDGGDGEPLRYAWATHGHTAEPVPVLAWGPGAEAFSGVHDNTEIATRLAAVLGLECCGHQEIHKPPAADATAGQPGL